MTPLADLLALLQSLPDTKGTVCFDVDPFMPGFMLSEQDHGYLARCTVGGRLFFGRALNLEEAVQILTDKIKKKYAKP